MRIPQYHFRHSSSRCLDYLKKRSFFLRKKERQIEREIGECNGVNNLLAEATIAKEDGNNNKHASWIDPIHEVLLFEDFALQE